MLTTRRLLKVLGTGILGLVFVAAGVFTLSPQARADAVNVFLNRSNRVMSVYPTYDAFSVGSSTANGVGQSATTTIGKLSVTLNPNDAYLGTTFEGYKKAFQIASTTTGGGTATSTADIFSITRAGCVNTVATSSATPVKLNFLAVSTTSANGFVTWSYGTCSS